MLLTISAIQPRLWDGFANVGVNDCFFDVLALSIQLHIFHYLLHFD